jgi:hypothetical protein
LQSPAYSKKGFTGMKQFVILLLLLSLFSALFIGCDEQNPALSPDGSGNQEDSFDDTYDTDISKPTGNITKPPAENEDTNSSGENEDSDTTAPATVEYGQDLRLAESPDDPIFTCLGASNTSLAGRVAIQATYRPVPRRFGVGQRFCRLYRYYGDIHCRRNFVYQSMCILRLYFPDRYLSSFLSAHDQRLCFCRLRQFDRHPLLWYTPGLATDRSEG